MAVASVALLTNALAAAGSVAASELSISQDSYGLAVNVSWPAVAGAATYEVYRDDDAVVALTASTQLATTAATSWRDMKETAGATYWYRVIARDGAGQTVADVGGQVTTSTLTAGPQHDAEAWLADQQEAAQGFRVRFSADYDSSYNGRVSGTVEDFDQLDGERLQVPQVTFSQEYSDSYVGPVHGTWANVAELDAFEVRVYSRSDDLYEQGRYPLRSDGTWTSGDEIARAGEKVARLVRKADDRVIAINGDSSTAIEGLAVRVFSRSDIDYLQDRGSAVGGHTGVISRVDLAF